MITASWQHSTGDPAGLCCALAVPDLFLLTLPGDSTAEIACGTCFCEVEPQDTTTMDCGHTFCNDCWRQHCRIQISEGRSRQLACMAAGCGAICDESRVCRCDGLQPLPLQRVACAKRDEVCSIHRETCCTCLSMLVQAGCCWGQVKTLLADQPALQQRYSDTLLDSFVDDNKRVKWCAVLRLQLPNMLHPACLCTGISDAKTKVGACGAHAN
jgi:hypothetical protein